MTDRLAQHCRFSEEYNAAYRIFSSATVGSQRKASLRYCPGQTTTILISGFSFARSKKRAEDLRRRSSALGAGDRTRTGTLSPAADFESATSTNSITPANQDTPDSIEHLPRECKKNFTGIWPNCHAAVCKSFVNPQSGTTQPAKIVLHYTLEK